MGLEAYLFIVNFKKPVPETDIVNLFHTIGMTHLADQHQLHTNESFGVWNFELRTELGLTEVQCLLPPEKQLLTNCSFRFSVISPSTVLAQTFDLFEKLGRIRSITIKDIEIMNHLHWFLKTDQQLQDYFITRFGELNEPNVEKASYIANDLTDFLANEWKVGKRKMVITNITGEIVSAGRETFDVMEDKGIQFRF